MPEKTPSRNVIAVEGKGFLRVLNRFVVILFEEVHKTEPAQNFLVVRVEFVSFGKVFQNFIVVVEFVAVNSAQIQRRNTEFLPRFGFGRVTFQSLSRKFGRLAIAIRRLVVVAQVIINITESVPGVGIVGLVLDGFVEIFDCLFVVALAAVNVAALIPSHCVFRGDLNCLQDKFFCAVKVALMH